MVSKSRGKRQTYSVDELRSLIFGNHEDYLKFLRKRVLTTVNRYYSEASHAEKEEFAQVVMYRLHERINKLNPRKQWNLLWLIREIVREVCLPAIRTKNRRKDKAEMVSFEEISVRPTREGDYISSIGFADHSVLTPESLAIQDQQKKAFEDALDKLRPRNKAVLIYVEIDEHSHKEAAKVFGVSVGRIKSLVHESKAELRNKLGEKFRL